LWTNLPIGPFCSATENSCYSLIRECGRAAQRSAKSNQDGLKFPLERRIRDQDGLSD